jgi:hypothetical protein
MNVEAKELDLIERFMKFRDESAIREMEKAISKIEMNTRADASIDDVQKNNVRSYDEFSQEIKLWMMNRKNSK